LLAVSRVAAASPGSCAASQATLEASIPGAAPPSPVAASIASLASGPASGRIVASGGWSRRHTLFGGDQYASRSDDRLDPASEAARIRAFYVSPEFSRRGLGTMLISACADAAIAAGFHRLALMATLTGIPLYEKAGFRAVEPTEITLPDGVRFPLVRMERDLA
jgi:GNAT superfamily N-acetyltransferase